MALSCALLVWMLGILGASPDLHALFHPDADHAGHSCAITLFQHGLEDPVAGLDGAMAPPTPVSERLAPVVAAAVASLTERLLPACGPPRN